MNLRQFIAEVKRRGIYQVTVYYSTGSWLLLQVADVLIPAFAIPDWTINALLVLAVQVGYLYLDRLIHQQTEQTPARRSREQGHCYAGLDNREQALEHINLALRLAPEITR